MALPSEAVQRNLTHPARRAWLDLLLETRRTPATSALAAGNLTGVVRMGEVSKSRAECRATFERLGPALRAMPPVY